MVLALKLLNGKTGERIWKEENFSGDANYFVLGSRAGSLSQAAEEAIDRLARNVVDRITEDW